MKNDACGEGHDIYVSNSTASGFDVAGPVRAYIDLLRECGCARTGVPFFMPTGRAGTMHFDGGVNTGNGHANTGNGHAPGVHYRGCVVFIFIHIFFVHCARGEGGLLQTVLFIF